MFDDLTGRLESTFKRLRGLGKLSEDNIKESLREVRLALLEADVNYQVARDFIKGVREKAVGAETLKSLNPGEQVFKIVYDELIQLLGETPEPIQLAETKPTVVMLVGLQGSGKTTSCGKLSLQFKQEGKKVLLVAADIYRPAAIEQLQTIGRQVDVPVLTIPGAKPPELAAAAKERAREEGTDIIIIDTAGRLQIDDQLMQELVDVKEVITPHEVLFVADGMAGQEAVNVTKTFNDRVGVDGVILTKMDGDARGGAALSIRSVVGKPIKYLGIGEKLDLLETFRPEGIARRILGQGDMMSIVEKVQKAYDEDDVERMRKQLLENRFTMEDLLNYLQQVKKLGSMSQLLDMMPKHMRPKGMPSGDLAEETEKQLKRTEALIHSMTKDERQNPELVRRTKGRRARIAKGAGMSVMDVTNLLQEYDEAKAMFSQMSALANGGMMGGLGSMGAGMMKAGAGKALNAARGLFGGGGGAPPPGAPGMPQMPSMPSGSATGRAARREQKKLERKAAKKRERRSQRKNRKRR